MDELYARIGRQAIRIEQQDTAFEALLNHFADVLEGKIDPRRVLINRTGKELQIAPDGFTAAMPATINGFPVCAVYTPFKFPPEPEPEKAEAEAAPPPG